jgi:hypothetical protein
VTPKAKTGSRRPTRKSASAGSTRNGPVPPYGDPIRDAIERGDIRAMRRVAADARKWLTQTEKQIKTVRIALADLERAIAGLGR